jgi:hypothetical protein
VYVRRHRRGMGDCDFEGDPTCSNPCYPTSFVGPLPAGGSYCAGATAVFVSNDPAACYPSTFVGPLPPNASYCSTPLGVSTPSTGGGCPVGSTCTIFSGVPNTGVYAMGALLAAFLLMGSMSGRR